jgi:SAM-dependent methyltransferase
MALHNLVTFKHRLTQALNASGSIRELMSLRDKIANIKFQVAELNPENTAYVEGLVKHYDDLIEQAIQPMEQLDSHLSKINDEINSITYKLFASNYELEERFGSIDHVRNNRRIYVREEVEDAIKQRILLHTSWRYPALEIGCRDGEWTQFLVAADPLYIMDRFPEFIESTAGKFTPEYQRRLRQYPLINHDLSTLPQAQMAFVFSWGYFNYVSMDTMKQYLRQVYSVLRPGGVFMFSYNDGDTPAGAGMAENFAQTYMPKSMLIPLCESIGYSITNEFDFEPNISWIEIKKPGTLHTVKAHQVMGEIKTINI